MSDYTLELELIGERFLEEKREPSLSPAAKKISTALAAISFSIAAGASLSTTLPKKKVVKLGLVTDQQSTTEITGTEEILLAPESKPTAPTFKKTDPLTCTQADLKNITTLITKTGNDDYWTLFWAQDEMYALGDKIRHVHPLKLLSVIFTRSDLKECMRKIWDASLKKTPFLKDLTDSFDQQKENLACHIASFAAEVKKDEQKVRELIDKSSWDELVKLLLN
jgi:hypothetical protein